MDPRTTPESKDLQESQPKKTSSRPQSPDPERNSRYKLSISTIPFFTPKPKAGGMSHSQSMPEFGLDDSASPTASTSPRSPDRLRSSAKSTSPKLSSSPSSRRSHPDSQAEETNKIYQLAALEDALQTALPEGFNLTEFSSSISDNKIAPGMFYFTIANTNGDVVFKESHPIYRLNALDDFVEIFNKKCTYAKLDAETIARGMNPTNFILSPIKLNFGQAVFVTGESAALGNWTTCLRLHFNKTQQAWRLTLPAGIDDPNYKYKTGAYAETDINKLAWEQYEGNRQLLPLQLQNSRKLSMK